MRCVTWGRDSHGLFDYESRQIAKRNIKSYTGGKIIRLHNDVEFISKQSSASDYGTDAKPLIVVHEKTGKFFVENDTLVPFSAEEGQKVVPDEDVNNKMFIVDYKLKRGDIIKLGRIKFKVKDFRTDTAPANLDMNKRQSVSPVKKGTNIVSGPGNCAMTLQVEDEYWLGGDDFSEEAIEIDCGVVDATQNDIICKVCWGNEQSPQNPLLNSCKCDGSVRYIHYECLKHWLKQKMQKKEENNLISYSWKQFECEICKKPYPYVFKSNGRKYRLVDVEVPEEKKFLWLESLTFEKNSSRMVHLIMPDEQMSTFKLGRGHESDVRVSDISVSRCHAILKYESNDNAYYLEDNLSKFGTLVLAKQAIELDVSQTQAVQIGRSVISFTVKPITATPIQQSPSKATIQVAQQSVEELLRQKIEETNQKINRIMAMNSGANTSNNQDANIHPHHNDIDQDADFNMYLQAMHNPDERPIIQPRQQQQQQQHEPEPHECNDPRCQYHLLEYNQEEREKLTHTLQRFEKMIQNVEQRLAERDHRYQNALRQEQVQQHVQNQQSNYNSPPRVREQLNHQIQNNFQENESPQDEVDEAVMRTQYKHQVTHNEWKYRELLNHHDDGNSPLLCNNNFISADKPTISFDQLKSKYGNSHQQYPPTIMNPERQDNFFDMEDYKEGEYLNVAEENEEDPPLRLRGQQLESDHSPVRVEKVDLQKYIQQHTVHNNMDSYPQFNRNVNITSKCNSHFPPTNNFIGESHLFNAIENQDLSKFEDNSKQQVFLSHSPSKNEFNRKGAYDNNNNSQIRLSNHKTVSSGISVPMRNNFNNHSSSRQQSIDKKDIKSSIYKYHEQAQQSRVQQQQLNNNQYKRTSSQSPWKLISEDQQEQHTVITPIKEPMHSKRPVDSMQHQTIGGNYKNSKQISSTYSKLTPANTSPMKSMAAQQSQYTPGKAARGKDSSIGRSTVTNRNTSGANSYAQNSASKRKKTGGPSGPTTTNGGVINHGVMQTLYSRHQQQHQTIDKQNMRY